jgi:hypothetical protein
MSREVFGSGKILIRGRIELMLWAKGTRPFGSFGFAVIRSLRFAVICCHRYKSEVGGQIVDFRLQISDLGYEMWDFEFQISNFELEFRITERGMRIF